MVCKNCGNEMQDDARFCPHCGAVNGPEQGGLSQEAAPAWEGPEGGGGKKKTGLIVGIGIAVVAVIALAAVFAGGLFGSPRGTVEKAFLKSAAAYRAAEEKLGLPDIEQWQKDQTLSQRMDLELQSINTELTGYDLSALSGLGLGLGTSLDGGSRLLSFDLEAVWGDDELFSFRMGANDSELYFNSPQLTGSVYYGVDTETLGADLAELTGDDSVRSMSFNLFDLIDLMLERMDREAMDQELKEVCKTLWEETQVKKSGARTMNINGTDTKTTAYHVTVPQDALNRFVDGLTGVLSAVDYYGLYEETFRAMGMPEEEIEDFLYELEDLDVYGELAGFLHEWVDETGDLELDVCLSGGYVSAVEYEGDFGSGGSLKLSLYLGGGEEYVDGISLDIETPSFTVEAESSGDHGLKSGVYTDETTVRVRQDSTTLARVTSELSIDPSVRHDNFQWKLGVDSSGLSIFVLETAGDLELDEEHMYLSLENMSLRTMGMEICDLAFDYYVDCHPSTMAVTNPRLITQMSEQELMQAGADLQANAEDWIIGMQSLLLNRLPGDLLWLLMGSGVLY